MKTHTHAHTGFCALFNAMRLPIKRNEMNSILAADGGACVGGLGGGVGYMERKPPQQVHQTHPQLTSDVPSFQQAFQGMRQR